MSSHTIADRYTVTARIGAGGGGVVWEATDEVLGRTVAVKEVALPAHLPEHERQVLRTRTLREARSSARLQHRSVVSVYDVIDDDEAIHIVMEHVDAPSLATLIDRDGPLSPERVIRIGLDVLEGLAAAHRADVVHRDVKPSNVLVPDHGPALVTDFGIAAVLGESRLTRTGQALGTPDYIAPEQLSDEPVGPASDVWALGATLFHAVEGVPPFHRERTMATIHAVTGAEPRGTSRAGPLASALSAMLVKDPAERPDVDTTRELLRTALEDVTREAERTQPVAAAATQELTADAQPETTPITQTTPDDDGADHDVAWDAPQDGPGRRGRVLAAVLATVLVAAVGFAIAADDTVLTGGRGPSDSGQPSPTATTPAEGGTTESASTTTPGTGTEEEATPSPETTTAPDEPSPSPSQDDGAASGDEGLPDGWTTFDGGAYAVGVPGDWTTRDGPATAIDLVAPSGDTYLRVADTDDPASDVMADTQRIRDSFRSRYDSYREIAIEPVDYRGWEAVRWTYTYAPEGQERRAVHLNFSTGERGYSLNFQGPVGDWDRLAAQFDEFTRTFTEQ